ncbi:Endo-1,4-beta-xylanase 5 [Linum grandiflorum]
MTNPNLNNGLQGWSEYGNPQLGHRVSKTRNNSFIVAHSRTQPHDSVSQKVYLQKDRLYSFSAWIQISGEENVAVTAGFETSNGVFIVAGRVIAEPGCWSMLKGGLTVNTSTSGISDLYFYSQNSTVDVWIDSVSLQPFTHQEWKYHQDQSIEQVRKRKVKIQVVDKQGNPLPNATVSIRTIANNFPFGCAINQNILSNAAYQNWFTSRGFSVTTFENEMKWYSTESWRGHEDYSTADAMLQFAEQHNVAVRGHNVLWSPFNITQPSWLDSLRPREFLSAIKTRIKSVVSRYKGQVISWDVVNESLHYTSLENRFGKYIFALVYNLAYKADGGATPLFFNEYNTVEESRDGTSTPARYLQKLREIRRFADNYKIEFGIGLEGHFRANPNIPYMRASMDTLAAAKLPIWLTEVDVEWSPNQATFLEEVLREGHAHPSVQGMVVWGAWNPQGCFKMCLTDNSFRNLPTGDVVDKLLLEWGGRGAAFSSYVVGQTDENGYLETSLFHGDYNVSITAGNSSVAASKFVVAPFDSTTKPHLLLLQATI